MEPVLNLKRIHTDTVQYDYCILCQDHQRDTLFVASIKGLTTLQDAAHKRQKLIDSSYREAIDRVNNAFQTNCGQSLVWHKCC